MKFISKTWAKALLLVVYGIGMASIADAQTYTWRGTNSTAWGTAGNWLALAVCPNNVTASARLSVNNAAFNQLVYDASLGTTILSGGAGTGRALVIGSGSLGNGALTINGGTLICTNTGNDVIQNSANNTGSLTVNGGKFLDYDPGINLGLGANGNNSTAIFTINGGNVLAGSLSFNVQRGTINYNGGVTAFSNMTAVISGTLSTCTNNFNGGTVSPRANTTAFIPVISQANVRDGGAVIDTAGFNITIAQPLDHSVISGDAAVDGGLTKAGNGVLTLKNVPTYTGPTRVNAGTLVSPIPQTSSALVLASGARFTPSLTNSTAFMASAALTNSTIDFNYGNWPLNSYTAANMYFTSLAISGSVTCNITGTGFPITTLTLLSYGSKTGGGSFVLGTLPAGAVATLNDDGANVTLNITAGSIQNLTWSIGDGIWQKNGGLDWNSGTATYLEYPSGVNDVVTFDDTASGTVNITGQVNPSSTTVNNSGGDYTFSGVGSIGGTNGITKTGTSTLEIDNANNFTGSVTISGGSGAAGGTILVGNSTALGATNGVVTVSGPANTLKIGTNSGPAITVTGKTVVINGTGVGGARGALRGSVVDSGTNEWAGPVIVGADQARIGTEDSGNLTVSGTITDNGANYILIIRPGISGTVTISGTNNNYGATRTFGDNSSSYIKSGVNNAFATNRLDLGQGYLDLNGFNQTFAGINDVNGLGKIINNGLGAVTLTINTGTNSAGTFTTGGDILDGTSVLNVVKTGLGRQTFNGVNVTYSGTTLISGGQLSFSSVNPINTAITVDAGGALSGEGTTTNSLTFNANSTLIVDPATAGSFTADTVNASASPIKVNFSSAAPSGTATLLLTAVNGFTGPSSNFQSIGTRGGIFYYTNSNTQLMFVPSAVNASLTWKGNNGTNPTFWDTITTTNWSNGGTPDIFYAGDNVLFDNTASSFTVAIQGSVVPTSVTVNSANGYNFTGVISGGTVTKGGTGTLFFVNNNTYTGLTTITNGILAIQTSTALGTTASGTAISGSGTLDLNTGAAFANTINLGAEVLTISGNGFGAQGTIVNNSSTAEQQNAVQQVVMAGNASIGGSFRWDMRGPGNALDMQDINTLTKVGGNQVSLVGTTVNNPGNIVVNGGILSIENSAALNGSSANTMTVNNGGTLNFYQSSSAPTWNLLLNGGSILAATSGNGALNHWTGPITLNGAATLNANGGHIYLDAEITGSGSLVKTGTSGATLSVSNSYTGNTTVSVGILELDFPSLASASTITIASNAVLNLNYTDTNTVAALVLDGTNQPAGIYDATTGAPFITGTGALLVGTSAQPVLSVLNLGGSLQFSWTGGGNLQAQTNSLNVGLGTNWVDYPGSSPVTVPINPANGSVFFRVKQ